MDSHIVIQTTAKQLLGAAATVATAVMVLVGGFWAVNALTFGDTKEDVRQIREILQKLSEEDIAMRDLLRGTDVALRDKIHETREIVARNEASLGFLIEGHKELKTEVGDIKSMLVNAGFKQ